MGANNTLENKNAANWHRIILIAGIVAIAFNLRAGITSVGPLIGVIRDDLGLANWNVGLLTSLPLIAFAVMSPIVPSLSRRFTNERIIILGLILLMLGIGIRSSTIVSFLFIGTIFLGLGIAICNVLLPGVIKENFPLKVALMTSIYSTVMGTFAATASGLSIPFAKGLEWGWQLALLVWILPVLIAVLLWLYLAKKKKPSNDNNNIDVDIEHKAIGERRIWYSPLAWQVALFMGFQSSLFYITISWLPEILIANGVSSATAGWMLSFTQFVGIPASFFVPVIANRNKSQRGMVLILGMLYVTGYSGLLLGNSFPILVISTILVGVPLSGTFALALTFLGLRAKNAKHASALSGMAQSIGYLLAALGPVCIGYLYDLTNVWTIPLLTLIGLSILVIIFGIHAGKDKYVLN